MANANFLQEFDDSLKKLSQLNDVIVANTQSKKEYSTAIIQNLKAINEKIKGLLDKVKQLKTQIKSKRSRSIREKCFTIHFLEHFLQ